MVRKVTKMLIVEQYIGNYDKKFYLRELALLLRKPHQTIKPYVEVLVKDGILIKNKRKNLVEYSLNFKDKKIYDYLVIAEKEKLMKKLRESIYLRVLFEKLSPFFKNETFIVFGSSVEKILKGSDIDLLIVGKQNISDVLEDFEKVYNKKIHMIRVTNMEKLTLPLIKEIYKKHLIFNNTEQIIRFFGGLHEQNKLV